MVFTGAFSPRAARYPSRSCLKTLHVPPVVRSSAGSESMAAGSTIVAPCAVSVSTARVKTRTTSLSVVGRS